MTALRKSMETYGYLTPVIIDQDNNIADGEHRVLVYKQLGRTQIPVFKINLSTDTDRRILRQVMNKLHGEHERQLDSNELLQIFQDNKLTDLATLIGQQQTDLQYAISRYHPEIWFAKEENFDLQKSLDTIVPTAQLGDMWQLGKHRLICADCSDNRALSRLLEDSPIHQLNCDPPYGVDYGKKNEFLNNYDKGNRIQEEFENDELEQDTYTLFKTIFTNLEPHWAEYNTIYIWSLGLHLHEIRTAMLSSDIKWGDYLIWIKNQHVLSHKDYYAQHEFCIYGWHNKHKFYPDTARTTVLNYDKPIRNDVHPTMKPIDLVKQTIEDGTQKGDNVLDLFTGSGTALLACEQSERTFFGIELDPHYVDVIIKRWEDFTSMQAVKL